MLTRKNKIASKHCFKFKERSPGPHTYKTRWPDGRGVNVLTLCQYINTSSVRSCISIV